MSNLAKFNVIYADPPWSYSDRGCNGAASKQYALLDNRTIAALPVHLLAANDCVLFMWATYPLLPEALATISGWGFEYKSIAFQWIKLNPKSETAFYGLGRWTRGNTEPCLLATKGKPKAISKSVSQLIEEPLLAQEAVGRHSAKPPQAREKIVQLMGDVPRIELFARERCAGWASTGLDLDGFDIRDVLQVYQQETAA